MAGRRFTREEQIKRMNEVHEGRYTYENWEHPTSHQKSLITCPEHGDFSQAYNNHVNHGSGCPLCAGAIMSEVTRERWQDPEFREKMSNHSSKQMKERWQDPEFREKMLVHLRKTRIAVSQDGYKPHLKPLTDEQFRLLLEVAVEEREIFQESGPEDLVADPMNYIASGEFVDRNDLLPYLDNAISNGSETAVGLLANIKEYDKPED